MELSWSTLLLEIINFAVLVWILLRFLYRPLQTVIARRQAEIEAQLSQAERLKQDAEQLRKQYENRLEHWEQIQQSERQTLQQQLAVERSRLEQELEQSLEATRQKALVVQQRQQMEQQHRLEQTALEQGGRFATKLLSVAAGPELQGRLLQLLIDTLPKLPQDQLDAIRDREGDDTPVLVKSAFELSDHERQRLQQALAQLLATSPELAFSLDSALIAGVEIDIGPWILHANLRNELKGFTEFAHEQR